MTPANMCSDGLGKKYQNRKIAVVKGATKGGKGLVVKEQRRNFA